MSKKEYLDGATRVYQCRRASDNITVTIVGDQHGKHGDCETALRTATPQARRNYSIKNYFLLFWALVNVHKRVNIFIETTNQDTKDYVNDFINEAYTEKVFDNPDIGFYNVEMRSLTAINKYIKLLQRLDIAFGFSFEELKELDPEDPLQPFLYMYNHESILERGRGISFDLQQWFADDINVADVNIDGALTLKFDDIMVLKKLILAELGNSAIRPQDRQRLSTLLNRATTNASTFNNASRGLIQSLHAFDFAIQNNQFTTFDQVQAYIEQIHQRYFKFLVPRLAYFQDLYTVVLMLQQSAIPMGHSEMTSKQSFVLVGGNHADNIRDILSYLKFDTPKRFTTSIGRQCLDITGYPWS
jgi:hypothetical protein